MPFKVCFMFGEEIPKGTFSASMQKFEDVGNNFQCTERSTVGLLPTSTQGNKQILAFIDHFTKNVPVGALDNQMGDTVAMNLSKKCL